MMENIYMFKAMCDFFEVIQNHIKIIKFLYTGNDDRHNVYLLPSSVLFSGREETIYSLTHYSLFFSYPFISMQQRSGSYLWEITYNQLSNYKQKGHCRFRETHFLLFLMTQNKLHKETFLQHNLVDRNSFQHNK